VKTQTRLLAQEPPPMSRERATGTHENPPPGDDRPPSGSPAAAATTESEAPAPPPLPEPRRDQLNALEIRALTQELQGLLGAYVEKAYQPTKHELLLRLRQPGIGRRDLYAKRGQLLLVTENPPANPTTPSAFAMAIRRNVSGGRIYKIEQAGFDRIVTLHVQKRDGDHRIVLELFGDGNCLLLRPDGRIFLPLVHEAWKTRVLRPGAPYETPPARDDPTTFDEATFIEKARQGNRDLVRALAREVGLGGSIAEEVLARSDIPKTTSVEDADDATLQSLFESWSKLVAEVHDGPIRGRLLIEDERAVDCAPHQSLLLEQEAAGDPARYRIEETPTFSAALDKLHLEGRRSQEAQEESKRVDTAKTKLETQRDAQEEAIKKFTRQEEEKRLEGELLFANYQLVERVLNGILQARKEHEWDTIQARIEEGKKAGNPDAGRIVKIEPANKRLVLRLDAPDGSQSEIAIDITKSLTENAQDAYTRSKTARSKLQGAEKALAETRRRLEATSREAEIAAEEAREVAARPAHLIESSRHHWFESYRWMYASTGELVLGGRDAASNDRLVKKHLGENDRYVHADIHGAPSTIVKSLDAKATPSETALEEAGIFAAAYSRAFAQAGSADAYWATPTQVSKTPEAGEHLARGAFIVRGKRTWMRKLPMEIAIGRVWLDKDGRLAPAPEDPADPGPLRAKLMGGAPQAVAAHADRHLVIGPGKTDRRKATRAIARAFDAHPDPVERLLPPGSIALLSTHGLHISEDAFEDGGP
jgi:predicted ribosome quality control (RQC) complex YloA/Tae2 family protein